MATRKLVIHDPIEEMFQPTLEDIQEIDEMRTEVEAPVKPKRKYVRKPKPVVIDENMNAAFDKLQKDILRDSDEPVIDASLETPDVSVKELEDMLEKVVAALDEQPVTFNRARKFSKRHDPSYRKHATLSKRIAIAKRKARKVSGRNRKINRSK